MAFRFVDLFAGIGGFHAALIRHGGELVFASDIDRRARDVYTSNWTACSTAIEVAGDIRPLTEGRCKRIPDHEVLTAGFPCQPFSKSGRQLGVAEERGLLFYSILKVLRCRQPKLVLLENVRNLVGPRHRQDYEQMVTLMRKLGYAVPEEPTILSPHTIPHSEGGSPQHRERVFIIGMHVGAQRAKHFYIPQISSPRPFPEWDPRQWDLQSFLRDVRPTEDEARELRISVETERALSAWEDFTLRFVRMNPETPLPAFPMWTEYWRVRSRLRIPRETPDWKRTLILKNAAFYELNRKWIDRWMGAIDLQSFGPSLRKYEWQAGKPRSLWECLVQVRPSGIRVKRPDYIPALVAIKQTPILGWERRELSAREAALLQGFQPDMNFGSQTRSSTLTQLGNAVHVGTAEFVFERAVQVARELGLDWADDMWTGPSSIANQDRGYGGRI